MEKGWHRTDFVRDPLVIQYLTDDRGRDTHRAIKNYPQ